jgi:hypothetical protein
VGGGGEFLEAGGGEGFVGLPADVAVAVDEEDVGGVGCGGGEGSDLFPGVFVGGEGDEVGLKDVGDLFADAAEDEGADEGGGVLEEGHVVEVDGGGGGEGSADGFFPRGSGVGGGVGEAEDEDGGGCVEVVGEGDGVAVECGAGGGGDGGCGGGERKKEGGEKSAGIHWCYLRRWGGALGWGFGGDLMG